MGDYQIVIGTRGRAVQRNIVCWGFFTYGVASIFAGLYTSINLSITEHVELPALLSMLALYVIMGELVIYFGILGFAPIKTNNLSLDKDVLVYDPSKDAFIGYNCRKNNEQVVIKNGAIIDVRGSAFYNSRELIVTYKDENEKVKKVSLGFCSNISRYEFRNKLNQYHSRKI